MKYFVLCEMEGEYDFRDFNSAENVIKFIEGELKQENYEVDDITVIYGKKLDIKPYETVSKISLYGC